MASAIGERSSDCRPAHPCPNIPRARDHAAARAEFERVIAAKPAAPAFVLASAYVECARLAEAAGNRARAIDLYRAATTIVGADPHARDVARDELKRLTSSSHTK